MTLTTEQLRARAKFWRKKTIEAKWESVSIAQDMLQNADAFDELAANREAQPVGVMNIGSETCSDYLVAWTKAGAQLGKGVHWLYTAPPANAQAVVWEMRYWSDGYNIWGEWERITAEQHAEMSVQHATDNDYEFRVLYAAPTAPVVAEVRR